MNDYYTDEPIGWDDPDFDGARWDYVEPDQAPEQDQWLDDWQQAESQAAPPPIRMLQDMVRRQPWQIAMAKSFYEQARLMADYTDDADVVMFKSYYPTYRDMTVAQMRGYFSLRRLWRQGKYIDAPLSYIFVYVYELLMQVGVASAEEGYELLTELRQAYGGQGSRLDFYLGPWLRDYVVYHNLSDHFSDVFAAEQTADRLAAQLASYKTAADSQLVDTVCAVANYDIRHKPLFLKQPDKATAATAFVLKEVLKHIELTSHHKIETICYGRKQKRQMRMFENAVFYDPEPIRNADISVSPRHNYYCRNGLWQKDVYVATTPQANKLLGQVLREIDRQLRPVLHVRPLLKASAGMPSTQKAIGEAIVQWTQLQREEAERREAERRRVKIDFSQLGRIRTDADVVMQALIDTDEAEPTAEPGDTEPTATTEPALATEPAPTPEAPIETPAGQPEADSPEAIEREFLRLVLDGGDWANFLRVNHTPEGVMVEAINNRAMDEMGDIVLEDNGDGLHVVDDYADDVRKMIESEETNDNAQ